MLNYIWAVMILGAVVYAMVTGNMEDLTNGLLDSSKEAVNICMVMLGVVAMWSGVMEVARKSGIVEGITNKIYPFVHYMFPGIPRNQKALEYISTNIVANILGLGWAATPAGLKAMEELGKLEEERRNADAMPKGIASNEMCTFLVLNISSLQLIPVNIIAYRSQYGSVNPTAVVGPGIAATLCSTLVAVVFCKIMQDKS